MTSSTNVILDDLFRHHSGRMIAALTRCLGAGNLSLAETAIQDAFVRALQTWPYDGLPTKPDNWLLKVARNRALDIIRNEHFLIPTDPAEFERVEAAFMSIADESLDIYFSGEIADDLLRMIFLCCHNSLSRDIQITLVLKTLCGFSVPEIARAFLCKDKTIAQRLVRAKQTIREREMEFEVPTKQLFHQRLDAVMLALYLLFNEGYSAYDGVDLVREDLCKEAIRLCILLSEHKFTKGHTVYALLSMMLLHGSRLKARVDRNGDLMLLRDQDRSLWNQEMIQRGLCFLSLAIGGDEMTKFHIQAAIAACHAVAPSYEQTDWHQILEHYDLLVRMYPSPVTHLNRLVAVLMVYGPKKAEAELNEIPRIKELESYYLYHATAAEIYTRLGNTHQASLCYQIALKVVRTVPERRFLEARFEANNFRGGDL